jgi:hypothetical protein
MHSGAALQYPFRALKLVPARRRKAMPGSIDEVLNHANARPDALRRHILARHRAGNLRC